MENSLQLIETCLQYEGENELREFIKENLVNSGWSVRKDPPYHIIKAEAVDLMSSNNREFNVVLKSHLTKLSARFMTLAKSIKESSAKQLIASAAGDDDKISITIDEKNDLFLASGWEEKRIVRVREAASILGVSDQAIRLRISRGKIDHVKKDGKVYVKTSAIKNALANSKPKIKTQHKKNPSRVFIKGRVTNPSVKSSSKLAKVSSGFMDKLAVPDNKCYGFHVKDGRVTPHPRELQAVFRVKELNDSGYSSNYITQTLKSEGYEGKFQGTNISEMTVQKIISSNCYQS